MNEVSYKKIESLLVALWKKNGFSVTQFQAVEIPLPNDLDVALYINQSQKIYTTWSLLDEMVRLSLITLVGKRVTKQFSFVKLQLVVNVRKTVCEAKYDFGVAKYGSDSDKLRWLEKHWRPFFNPLRRIPLEEMITGRDFWCKTPSNSIHEMTNLSDAGENIPASSRSKNALPLPP